MRRLTSPLSAAVGHGLLLASLTVAALAQSTGPVPVYSWTTLAGRASVGREDGVLSQARFYNPYGLARDRGGNLYVADHGNHTNRMISSAGVVSTIAGSPGQPGSADGTGAAARFNGPRSIALDGSGNLYVTDTGNATVRKITPAGVVTTLAGQPGKRGTADGPATAALFDVPDRIAVDQAGSVYLADHGIRKISGGNVTTLYSSGQLVGYNSQTFAITPGTSLAVDASGQIYFSATAAPWTSPGTCLVKLDAAGVASFAYGPEYFGSGYYGNYAESIGPMAFDAAGTLYFTERFSLYYGYEELLQRARPFGFDTLTNINQSSRWADEPLGLAVDTNGWFLTRASDHAILKSDTPDGVYAGTAWSNYGIDGLGSTARFASIQALALDPAGNVWVTDEETWRIYQGRGSAGVSLRKITPAGEVSTPYYQSPTMDPVTNARSVAADGAGNVYFGASHTQLDIRQRTPVGAINFLPFSNLQGGYYGVDLAANSAGTVLLTQFKGAVNQWTAANGWSVLAGDPIPRVYVPDIRDGTGAAASFAEPVAATADRSGDFYVLDSKPAAGDSGGVCFIRKVTTAGMVTTISRNLVIRTGPTGSVTELAPYGLGLDSHGSFFLLYPDSTIRQLTAEGDPVVIGGAPGKYGSADGNSSQALFLSPTAIGVDAQDNLYVADATGQTIRKGQYLGTGPVVTLHPQSQLVPAGGSVTLTVAATGTPAPTYQWFISGAPIAGATGTSLTVSNFSKANVGDYTVNVTNSFAGVTSNGAVLTLSAAPPPTTDSGGGGAIGPWFVVALLVLGLGRRFGHEESRKATKKIP